MHSRLLQSVLLAAAGLGILSGCREPRSADGQASPPLADSQPATQVAATSPATPAPDTATVRRETLRRTAPAVGTLRARQTTRIAPQVAGRVQEVLVDVGDVVSTHQTLVRLDPTFFEIEVERTKAAIATESAGLASAVVDVASTEREMKRQVELFDRGAGSTKDRDDATSAYERAVACRAERESKVAEAQRRYDWAVEQLEETQIRAPFDGAITARLVDPGGPASTMPPTQLLEIQEVGVLYLEFSLPQELLGTVKPGTRINFDVEGISDGAGAAEVAVVFPAIDELTRSFRCRAIIGNAVRKYQPGLLARVNVVTQEVGDALVVPRTALAPTATGWQVILSEAGQLVSRPVEVGLVTDERAQVTQGLREGDLVVVSSSGNS